MSLIASLKNQFAHLVHELAKFGSIGAAAFLITLVLSNVLHPIGGMKSFAIATVVATTFSYFANRYWTFRHRERADMRREYVLFFILNGIGLAISELFIGFTQYTLGLTDKISYNVALVVGTGAATLFRYWSYKRWVFLAPSAPSAPPVPTPDPEPGPTAAALTHPQPAVRPAPAPAPADAGSR